MLRVVLCDDAVGFPDLVASWLQTDDGMELVATTGSATELLEVLPTQRADVVLLDLMLPEGPTTPELVERVRALAPGARVVLVSSLPVDLLQAEVVRTGADAAGPKATTAEQLRAVVRGEA